MANPAKLGNKDQGCRRNASHHLLGYKTLAQSCMYAVVRMPLRCQSLRRRCEELQVHLYTGLRQDEAGLLKVVLTTLHGGRTWEGGRLSHK